MLHSISQRLVVITAVAGLAGCASTQLSDPSLMDENADSVPTEETNLNGRTETDEYTYGAGSSSVDGSSRAVEGQDAGEALSLQEAAQRDAIVYFDYDRASIRPSESEKMYAHASYLAAYPDVTVRLESHADERGSREYNLALAERRGNAAIKFLVANGVAPSQVEVVSYGEERPMIYGHSESAWSRNRRVEFKYGR